MNLLPILIFIVILALLVLVHEFGHFIVAKRSGMIVEEFGFGFPPRLFSIVKNNTRYSFNLIPLGGFVKIKGENNENPEDKDSFINKPFWPRFGTLIAGVTMNFILAWVLFSVGLAIGLPTQITQGEEIPKRATLSEPQISVLDISPKSPAEKAGLRIGDVINAVNGRQFSTIDPLIAYTKSLEGENIKISLKRGSENLELETFVRPDPPQNEGPIGIALGLVGTISYPWYLAPAKGFQATINVISGTAVSFYQLVFKGQGLSSLGGPVKIASLTGQIAKLGFVYLLQFTAFLSVNLGFINIIPFPALDGGRVLFLLVEKLRGKRNNQTFERAANTLGFALLMFLIIIITARDIKSLF